MRSRQDIILYSICGKGTDTFWKYPRTQDISETSLLHLPDILVQIQIKIKSSKQHLVSIHCTKYQPKLFHDFGDGHKIFKWRYHITKNILAFCMYSIQCMYFTHEYYCKYVGHVNL
jgi:hypothetical protein